MYPTEANPTWTARKNDMKYSGWKLMAVAKAIQGKHLLEALAAVNASDKKGADIIKATLMAARKNGERKGFNEERMFVQRAIVHKKFSHKKMDIKGRGRTGLIQVPKCDLVVTLEEKQPADYYKMVMKGETPQGVASTIRKMMYQNNADLATVQAMSHLTTSEGRYYRRTQFKRLVQMVKSEYQARGISMKEDKIERNLLEKATGEFLQL
jgi:ribosomal protein L22